MRGMGVLGLFGPCGALYVTADSALSMIFLCMQQREDSNFTWIFARMCICRWLLLSHLAQMLAFIHLES